MGKPRHCSIKQKNMAQATHCLRKQKQSENGKSWPPLKAPKNKSTSKRQGISFEQILIFTFPKKNPRADLFKGAHYFRTSAPSSVKRNLLQIERQKFECSLLGQMEVSTVSECNNKVVIWQNLKNTQHRW